MIKESEDSKYCITSLTVNSVLDIFLKVSQNFLNTAAFKIIFMNTFCQWVNQHRSIRAHVKLDNIFWCPLLSVDCFHKLCLSGTPLENSQAVWDLENRIARGYRFDAKWVCPMGNVTCVRASFLIKLQACDLWFY